MPPARGEAPKATSAVSSPDTMHLFFGAGSSSKDPIGRTVSFYLSDIDP